jgi:hypothetical protein
MRLFHDQTTKKFPLLGKNLRTMTKGVTVRPYTSIGEEKHTLRRGGRRTGITEAVMFGSLHDHDLFAHDPLSNDSIFKFEPWEIDEEPVDLGQAKVGGEWVLAFPNDRTVGVVMVRAKEGEWVDHAPAYGRVAVPGDVEIGLRWDASAPVDVNVLSRLPADAVTSLDLEWSDITDDTVNALLRFDRLRDLKLGHTRITDAAMPTIGLLTSLRTVSLRGTSVGDEGAMHLRSMPQLSAVDLAATRITDETLETLGRSKTLNYLDVSANPWPRLTGRGLEALAKAKTLRTLSVAWTDLSDMLLAPISAMKGLRTLDLSGTRVTDIGLRLMEHLPLRQLTLCATPGVTNVAMTGLRRMASLESVELHDTGVDNLGVFDLWAVKPNCSVNGLTQPQWQAGALSGRWSAGESIVGAAA